MAVTSAFRMSGGMLSNPGACPSLSFLIALLTSSLDILPQLTCRSSVFSETLGGTSGGRLFNSSWKCSPPTLHLLGLFGEKVPLLVFYWPVCASVSSR